MAKFYKIHYYENEYPYAGVDHYYYSDNSWATFLDIVNVWSKKHNYATLYSADSLESLDHELSKNGYYRVSASKSINIAADIAVKE